MDEGDLEGRLLKIAAFFGGNRHMRDVISEMKMWDTPGNSALEKQPGTELAISIVVTLTTHPGIGAEGWHVGICCMFFS